ncbi:PspC domain-containing protein [Muricomes intestini]|jgi:phage shock protein PspC (stress-responsive transcriptional regulator)|uniref:Phage shock protein C (PspC) family protein n=1 Tax=Muricomes intestini TaxID=1796634 RepID=A0A4V2URD2_9FIRM|nr:PspC domain-containing protein [Muricomes intestini]TCS77212.1 phage shock protein C (PspC) family protein [Muricomes intestini]HAX52340.1 PspC domain-containing protein [Lachnospiraceae bacterium]HCR84636.1 PspC domain-containing protein [Lachnospiraceae bacterium]
MEPKKLYRSRTDRMICGVCGGIAEYFNIDATIVRLLFVLLGLTGGSGILAYFIAAIIIPDDK